MQKDDLRLQPSSVHMFRFRTLVKILMPRYYECKSHNTLKLKLLIELLVRILVEFIKKYYVSTKCDLK